MRFLQCVLALVFTLLCSAQLPSQCPGDSEVAGISDQDFMTRRTAVIFAMNALSVDEFQTWEEYKTAGEAVFTHDGGLFLPVTGLWGGPPPGTGVEGALEYMALANRFLNHGMIDISEITVDQTSVQVSNLGNTIDLDFIAHMDLYKNHENGRFAVEGFPMAGHWQVIFRPCTLKIERANLISEDLSTVFQGGLPSNGEICQKIQDSCFDFTDTDGKKHNNKQFPDVMTCVKWWNSIPPISCGPPGIMLGNSRLCHWLHLFLTPINPDVHCPHIGPHSDPFCKQSGCDSRIPCVDGCDGKSSGTSVEWNISFNNNKKTCESGESSCNA